VGVGGVGVGDKIDVKVGGEGKGEVVVWVGPGGYTSGDIL